MPRAGAAGWALSNPPIFSRAPLRASLPLFAEAGMPALRAKSLALTAYLESLLRRARGRGARRSSRRPTRAQRGCQLSVRVRARRRSAAGRYSSRCAARGVIVRLARAGHPAPGAGAAVQPLRRRAARRLALAQLLQRRPASLGTDMPDAALSPSSAPVRSAR